MIALFAPPPVRVADVQAAVAAEFGVTRMDLVSDRRPAAMTLPRHVAFLLAREMTPKSLAAIGAQFGDRDHSTVSHGIRRVEQALTPALRASIDRARDRARGLAAGRAAAVEARDAVQLGLRLALPAEPELAL